MLGDLEVRVPWCPADRWISCTTATLGPVTTLVGLTDDATGAAVVERIVDGRVTPEAAAAAAYDLLGQATPYKWWKSVRLMSLSCRDYIAGHLTLAGLDPRDLTVAQWCASVYTLITRNADDKTKFKTDVVFDDPPPGVVDDDWMSPDDFNAMVAAARAMPGQQ